VAVTLADHVALAISRLPEQLKSKTNVTALLTVLATPAQSLEQALYDLATKRSVYTATGATLDALGALIDQPRNGLGDSDYQRYILARVSTNESDGTAEDLITIAKLILNDAADTVTVQNIGAAAAIVRITGDATTDTIAGILIAFLREAIAGGVKVTLEAAPDVDTALFFTDLMSFLAGSHAIGTTTLNVDLTTNWPSSGSVTIEPGTGNSEVVTYAAISGGKFLNCSPTTKLHASGSQVQSTAPLGRGLGDSTDGGQPALTAYANVGSTGGRMTDARE